MKFLLDHFESLEGLQSMDIICAQTRSVNRHAGNRRYAEIVQQYRDAYTKTSQKEEKTKITRQVIDKTLEEGARFMKYDKTAKMWTAMERPAVHEKVSHALRSQNQTRRNKRKLGATTASATTCSPPSSPAPRATVSPSPAVRQGAQFQFQQQQQQQVSLQRPATLPLQLQQQNAPKKPRLVSQESIYAPINSNNTSPVVDTHRRPAPIRQRETSLLPLDMFRALSNELMGEFANSWSSDNNNAHTAQNNNANNANLEPLDMLRAKSADLLRNELVTAWAANLTAGQRQLSTAGLAASRQASLASCSSLNSTTTTTSMTAPLDMLRCMSNIPVVNFVDAALMSMASSSSSSTSATRPATIVVDKRQPSLGDMPIDVFDASFGSDRTNEFLRSWTGETSRPVQPTMV